VRSVAVMARRQRLKHILECMQLIALGSACALPDYLCSFLSPLLSSHLSSHLCLHC
jgi:hypothetical protein